MCDWLIKDWLQRTYRDPIGCLKYIQHIHTDHLHHFIGLENSGQGLSFPRERGPGTGTKNKIVTDWQFSVKKIQINKNPSMTARKLHNKCDSLQNLRTIIRTMKRYLTVLLHKNIVSFYLAPSVLIINFKLFGWVWIYIPHTWLPKSNFFY